MCDESLGRKLINIIMDFYRQYHPRTITIQLPTIKSRFTRGFVLSSVDIL